MSDAAIAEDIAEDMEPGAGLDDAEGEGRSGRGRSRIIMIAAGGLLLACAAAGSAAYFFGAVPTMSGKEKQVVESYYFDLPDMVVNLSALDERAQYLKLKVSLETHDKATLSVLQPAMPKILDAFQVYLRELRVTDIEGSAGLERLKEELARRINIAIHPATVDAVLFREILVQ